MRKIVIFGFVLIILLAGFVRAVDWVGNNITYNATEDTTYHHNLTANVTSPASDMVFSINETLGVQILWNDVAISYSNISGWIFVANSTTGDLVINATSDNQTGRFRIPLTVAWGGTNAATTSFNFTISAVNDAPYFTNLQNKTFNATQLFNYIIYGSDEENDLPFTFNITFISCSPANWSDRVSTNCTLFTSSQYSTNSTAINITFPPVKNDVGNYSIQFNITDNSSLGAKTTSIRVNFSVLDFNTVPVFTYICDNERNTTENNNFTCYINATDLGEEKNLTFSSNVSWFLNNNVSIVNSSTGYKGFAIVNFTPTDINVGNWSINISVTDGGIPGGAIKTNSSVIRFYVANVNDSVVLYPIANITVYNTSGITTLYINASDDDLLVPDKNVYNESLTFSSNTSWVNISINQTTGNRSVGRIQFNATLGNVGNNSVNISVRDANNYSSSSYVFVIQIIGNSPPSWNSSFVENYTLYEDTGFYLNLSANITDVEGDMINFSFTNSTAFPSFNLTISGIINFTPIDEDVGYHLIVINASDGKTTTSKNFNFTVYNIPDAPVITTPLTVINATIDAGSNMNATEGNYTIISFNVSDNDFKIPSNQKSFYNESLNLSLIIQGRNTSLFNFTRNSSFPSTQFPNITLYIANFTPSYSDVGVYNITINITDLSGNNTSLRFNLTVFSISHNPTLANITNYTSSINRAIYLRLNATDVEDGDSTVSGNNNFTFFYGMLTGASIFNSTTFNSTSGVINITFNSSQHGKYRVNVSVNDSTNRTDSKDFWIFIYNTPAILSPGSGYNFSLIEGNLSNLSFSVNHSVQDNLTCQFYIDSILRYNASYYGNSTNFTWQFAPNYTDESYSLFRNLTLIVLNPLYNDLNVSRTWNVNVTHTNSPINFSGSIGDKQATYDQTISINLRDYFSYIDYFDNHYNSSISSFSVGRSSVPTSIAYTFSNSTWVLAFSSTGVANETFNVTISNSFSSATSNNFAIQFTTPSTVNVPSGGGGGGGSTVAKYHSLKIIFPGDIVVSEKNHIEIPISIMNTGEISLSGINLSSVAMFNNLLTEDVRISLANTYIPQLNIGESKNLTVRVDANTQISGKYKITIYANVASPKFIDWGDFYIEFIKNIEAEQILAFTEKIIFDNPKCLELTELLNDAKKSFEEGDINISIIKAKQAVQACKAALESKESTMYNVDDVREIVYYVLLSTLVVFVIWFIFYIYKRIKFNKARREGYI